MNQQKIIMMSTLLLLSIFLFCMSASCSPQKEPEQTPTPVVSADVTATAPVNPNSDATQTADPATTPGEDNEVTFPSDWGDPGNSDTTQKPSKEPGNNPTKDIATEHKATAGAQTQTQTAATKPTENASAGNKPGTQKPSTTDTTDSPKPTADSTPIGTDEDGWIDKWY